MPHIAEALERLTSMADHDASAEAMAHEACEIVLDWRMMRRETAPLERLLGYWLAGETRRYDSLWEQLARAGRAEEAIAVGRRAQRLRSVGRLLEGAAPAGRDG